MQQLELKYSADSCEITGYASVWLGAVDAANDLVAPGAFAASLRQQMPAMLLEHKSSQVVGVWHTAVEDDIGLKVSGTVTAPETIAKLRKGKLDGLSIGFICNDSSTLEDGARIIKSCSLPEVSLVSRPCKSAARILQVKSCQPPKRKADASASKPRKVNIMDPTQNTDNCDPADDAEMDSRVKAVETAVSDLSTRVGSIESSLKTQTKSIDNLATVLRRPGAAALPAAEAGQIEIKAFDGFVRRGVERMDHLEAKSLRVSDDTAGGYLAPNQFVAELLRNVVLVSPIRSVARVMTTGSSNIILPKRTSTLTASWIGEVADRSATSPAYGSNQYNVAEMACYTDISNALLEDSAFDVASELAVDFAEQFGKSEGTAFVSGNGVLKPLGFMNHPDLLSTNSGDASKVTADGLIQILHDLAPVYRQNGTWAMNSATLAAVRKLKDPSTGHYLLIDGGMGNNPVPTLLGRPIIECPDLADIAGNAYPIVFGDFKNGFRIFDRLSLSVLRDPYSVATNGLTRFHARRRLAAGVAKAEALRKLKISA